MAGKEFIKKRWSDILFIIIILMLIIPQTRKPIIVFVQRIVATSPRIISNEKKEKLHSYDMMVEKGNGDVRSLEKERGNVVLINFWATWCPPCVAEMPYFQELYADYKDKISFYFITTDEWTAINKFENKNNYQLPYYKLLSIDAGLEYNKLPTTYIIDKKGNIVVKKVGVAKWNSKKMRKELDKLINE